MAKSTRPERPKSRLPDGRVNPAYTAWRKEFIAKEGAGGNKVSVAVSIDKTEPTIQEQVRARLAAMSPEERSAALAAALMEAEGEVLTLRVVKLPQNDRFVICEHPAEKGKTVSVRLWKRGIGQKLLKKSLRAEIRDGAFHQLR